MKKMTSAKMEQETRDIFHALTRVAEDLGEHSANAILNGVLNFAVSVVVEIERNSKVEVADEFARAFRKVHDINRRNAGKKKRMAQLPS